MTPLFVIIAVSFVAGFAGYKFATWRGDVSKKDARWGAVIPFVVVLLLGLSFAVHHVPSNGFRVTKSGEVYHTGQIEFVWAWEKSFTNETYYITRDKVRIWKTVSIQCDKIIKRVKYSAIVEVLGSFESYMKYRNTEVISSRFDIKDPNLEPVLKWALTEKFIEESKDRIYKSICVVGSEDLGWTMLEFLNKYFGETDLALKSFKSSVSY